MNDVLDQQFVAHVYVPLDGADAVAGYRALGEIWHGCRTLFGMTEPVPGTGLSNIFPDSADVFAPSGVVLGGAAPGGEEVALAAQERPGADCQAVLRLHHDVINLSMALAPPEATVPHDGGWLWWRIFDTRWDALIARHAAHLLGEARLYLARTGLAADIRVAAPALYDQLAGLLPADAADQRERSEMATRGVALPGGLAFWEAKPEPDERTLRRFVLAIVPDGDPVASAWVWSDGRVAIPPLARYLLHAAKLRYELRVLLRDNTTRQLHASLDAVSNELRRLGAADAAQTELLRLRRLNAVFLLADLRAMRQTVRIAADNLGRAFNLSGLLVPGGPFADDADLAHWMLQSVDDDLGYLGLAANRADQAAALTRSTGPRPEPAEQPIDQPSGQPEPVALAEGHRRDVFVVYGRDEPARLAVFVFLRSLGLRPLEWEHLVDLSGRTTPSLSEVVSLAMPLAQAVVVLLAPEDVVRLHPDLHSPHEAGAPTPDMLQARPNVLLELGMALAVHPRRTIMLIIGEHRPINDLGGLNYVRISTNPDFRLKIANRLRLAGCPVDTSGQDWLSAGDFAALSALHRSP